MVDLFSTNRHDEKKKKKKKKEKKKITKHIFKIKNYLLELSKFINKVHIETIFCSINMIW